MSENTAKNGKEADAVVEDTVMTDEVKVTETGVENPPPKKKKKRSQAYNDRRKTREYKDQRRERRYLRKLGTEAVSRPFHLSLQLSQRIGLTIFGYITASPTSPRPRSHSPSKGQAVVPAREP